MADMISVATGFQSSVNIAYDINDEAKLKIIFQQNLH